MLAPKLLDQLRGLEAALKWRPIQASVLLVTDVRASLPASSVTVCLQVSQVRVMAAAAQQAASHGIPRSNRLKVSLPIWTAAGGSEHRDHTRDDSQQWEPERQHLRG